MTRPPYGGGDSPAFINRMADWMESHPVTYHIYNDGHGDHSLETYPKSKATYKQRFGL
ncbi:MAG: hypothetical protein M3441_23755 [Chloroflexota bacterium]|nr:hypothetical protein [Chloroflexota bacterium]